MADKNTDSVNVGKEHSGGGALLSLDSQEQGFALDEAKIQENIRRVVEFVASWRGLYALHRNVEEGDYLACLRCSGESVQHGRNLMPADVAHDKGCPVAMAELTLPFVQEHRCHAICPGCRVPITEQNVGGYKTFCERCVKAMPPLPLEGAWSISGAYPNFRWVEAT